MYDTWANCFPYIAGALKLIVLAIGAYYAIKWHFDEDKRLREEAGEVFATPTAIKSLALKLALPVLILLLIILSVYSTIWLLDH